MTNDKNILSIDLTKIDREINNLDNEIAALQSKRDWLSKLREYVPSLAVMPSSTPSTSNINQSVNPNNTLASRVFFDSEPLSPNQFSVTEFVLNILSGLEADARYIIDAYANYTGKDYAAVRGNVFNAISRLKDIGKIEDIPEEGRKRGNKLRIKKAVNETAIF